MLEISYIADLLMKPIRKIIHIDLDCFYAAVEMRDAPELADKPAAVGGEAHRRGVIATCNYAARAFGVRAAMPTAQALKLCRHLVLRPVRMDVYR
jgi:DNA polymerase-4